MIKNFLSEDEPEPRPEAEAAPTDAGNSVLGLSDPSVPASEPPKPNADLPTAPKESELIVDNARGMGLAYSAGIAFTAAVVFMLVLGWGADLLLGTSPWGIVVGIVVGSIIGFIQLFRITSQIFKK